VRAVGSFVAIGDSFTEGYGDYYQDGSCQGWADRFARLRAGGSQVLLFSGFDPVGLPLMRPIRDKCLACNARIKDIAARHDCLHVDLWSMAVLATGDGLPAKAPRPAAPVDRRLGAVRPGDAVIASLNASWRRVVAYWQILVKKRGRFTARRKCSITTRTTLRENSDKSPA
jgi:hypothetical protein